MPFNHNNFYHSLLLKQVPEGARTALDVGCGAGLFARRLAAAGLDVDGVDQSAQMIDIATAQGSPGPGRTEYRQQDIAEAAPSAGRYDFISCLASIHHVPFETVTSLRAALRPGGVLAILGLGKPRSARDWVTWGLASPPLNLAARLLVHTGERLDGGPPTTAQAPVSDWAMSMAEIRRESAALLPGRTVRTLLFWRYLLVYRNE
ncbi:class I SAM-dependent methyltransferase [Amycolatopsis nigrescens]|uniref:class I SAM-dependent methyltransferase n=1 Tax=Amycolatopsis nigrescens TaxID=381445 RepID=UPI00036019FB|nr:class I SAM-dependent methyltransferase [Amycolatopsis nigrescens]